MKKYWTFAAVGYVLVLAALGFALDLGIVGHVALLDHSGVVREHYNCRFHRIKSDV